MLLLCATSLEDKLDRIERELAYLRDVVEQLDKRLNHVETELRGFRSYVETELRELRRLIDSRFLW